MRLETPFLAEKEPMAIALHSPRAAPSVILPDITLLCLATLIKRHMTLLTEIQPDITIFIVFSFEEVLSKAANRLEVFLSF